ncbi:hypothetical protein MKX03_015346 [Papaver bracteatum]|nr:hypothetical protein MKX03_015346 [Papaver bracteatum]
MLSTFDVYLSVKNKVSGEADWYGILGVSQYSDDETVRKQYKKLALMLHPDKNQSVGEDGAFKLISEAWSLLSDRTKRAAYDQMRFPITSHPEVSTTSSGPSSTYANVFRQYQGAKKKTNTDLYYDIAGWVVLAVVIVAWIGMAKSQVPL